MNEITKKTLIPLSLTAFICSIVFWAANVDSKVQNNANDISRLRDAHKVFKEREDVFEKDVIDRLARIETAINNKK